MRKDPTGFFTGLATEHGDFVQFDLGAEKPYYLLNHPDYIKEVLVTQDQKFTKWFAIDRIREVLGEGLFVSEGSFHRQQRLLTQPALHRQRVAEYAVIMVELAAQLRDRWQAGTVIDVCQEMNWLALMIVARTLFGANVEGETERIRDALSRILDQFERSILPQADRGDFDAALQQLDEVIHGLIQKRRATGDDRGDLLSMLLAAQNDEGQGMSDRQIRDEAMTIFLAGHETSANAMAWSWYLLSLHPEMEERFHAEMDQFLGSRLPRVSDVQNLTFTAMIFSESLRLYPPVWIVGRRAKETIQIGEYTIAAGSVVLVSQYVTHRDARWFPRPASFEPERWMPEVKAARPRFSYFPFSAGSRACLGEVFAGVEGVLCLATLAQKFSLRTVSDVTPTLQAQLTLRAKNGIRMSLERR